MRQMKEAVMAALNGCSLAHFATYAMFKSLKPFQSCIWMAKGEPLTLGELTPYLQKQSPSFVVLSACETGITRVTATPDEFLGFPAAFLEHGTRTVVSSLWAVDDLSTALLMDEFYRRHLSEGQEPAKALRGAQLWLRDGTADELHLADTYQRMYLASGRADKDAYDSYAPLQGQPEGKVPLFEHPYYWAGPPVVACKLRSAAVRKPTCVAPFGHPALFHLCQRVGEHGIGQPIRIAPGSIASRADRAALPIVFLSSISAV